MGLWLKLPPEGQWG